MPIDRALIVDPFEELIEPSSDFVSPFDIQEKAMEIQGKAPDIGPLEEVEGMLSLGTALIATPLAGLAGIGEDILQTIGLGTGTTPVDAVEYWSEALTYQPRTKGGKAFAKTLSIPFQMIEEASSWVGDQVFDLTESPDLAAGAKTATVFMVPGALRMAGKTVKVAGNQVLSGGKFVAESINMIRPKARAEFAKEAVGRSLRKNIGETVEVQERIAESAELVETIPGYRPTLAETTLQPGMAVRERALAETSQQAFDIARTRRTANIEAIEDFRRDNFGDSAPEISSILRKSEGNIKKALYALEDRLVEIRNKRETLAQKYPTTDLEIAGKKLRKLEKEEYEAAKAVGEIKYNQIGEAKVDPRPVTRELNTMFKNDLLDYSLDEIPMSFKQIVRTIGDKTEISFDSLRSAEKRLNRELAAETGSPRPNGTTMTLITDVLKKVEEVKQKLEKTGGADVVKALREANAYWKEGVVDRFYKGAGRDIHAKNPSNEFKIVDEKVIDSFFTTATKTKGGVKGIDDFINTYGMNPKAWVQLRLGIYEKFKEASGVNQTGVIDSIKAERFINKYRNVLDRVPPIKRELTESLKSSQYLDGAAQLIKQRETNIDKSVLSRMIKTNTPETIVKNAIKEHGREMVILRAMARNTRDGMEALSRETGRQLLLKSERTNGTITSDKLLNEMRKNQNSLRIGLTPKHYKSLYDLHNAYMRIDRNVLAQSIKEPKLGLEKAAETFGTTPAQAISAWRAKSRGMVGGPHLVAQLATSFITRLNKRQIDAIERIAHYDANVASTLLMMTKGKETPIIKKRVAKHLADYGLVSLSAGEQ